MIQNSNNLLMVILNYFRKTTKRTTTENICTCETQQQIDSVIGVNKGKQLRQTDIYGGRHFVSKSFVGAAQENVSSHKQLTTPISGKRSQTV